MKEFCDTTTSHGFGWYSRFDYILCKVVAVVIPAIAMFGLNVAAIQALVNQMVAKEMLTKSTKIDVPSLEYPSMILCHPNFFDMGKGMGNYC